MKQVSAEVSIYPLRQARLGPAVDAFLSALGAHQVKVDIGPASTAVVGELGEVFSGLRDGFVAADEIGECVLVLKLSNACGQGAGHQR